MRIKILALTASMTTVAIATAVIAQSQSNTAATAQQSQPNTTVIAQQSQPNTAGTAQQSQANDELPSRRRYLPEYTADGQLILPKNNIWREWVYVGVPFTPNALNGGQAGFPEFHNVYIEPGSYEIYKRTNAFPEGTILFKELQLTLTGPGSEMHFDRLGISSRRRRL